MHREREWEREGEREREGLLTLLGLGVFLGWMLFAALFRCPCRAEVEKRFLNTSAFGFKLTLSGLGFRS